MMSKLLTCLVVLCMVKVFGNDRNSVRVNSFIHRCIADRFGVNSFELIKEGDDYLEISLSFQIKNDSNISEIDSKCIIHISEIDLIYDNGDDKNRHFELTTKCPGISSKKKKEITRKCKPKRMEKIKRKSRRLSSWGNTNKPTAAPTPKPTNWATPKPTNWATPKPTNWATPKPTTKAPTTKAPTTKAPTTKAPTPWPTHKPTPKPTTKAPTTKAPTTKAPTTKAPTTKAPTPWPTHKPTPKPTTKSPTPWPTRKPTPKPTTKAPTTKAPTTKAPTTKAPTPWPTHKPTHKPTQKPTPKPTPKPTTKAPTPWPTRKPITPAPTQPSYIECGDSIIDGDYNDKEVVITVNMKYDGDMICDVSESQVKIIKFEYNGKWYHKKVVVDDNGFGKYIFRNLKAGKHEFSMKAEDGKYGKFSVSTSCPTKWPTPSPTTKSPTVWKKSSWLRR